MSNKQNTKNTKTKMEGITEKINLPAFSLNLKEYEKLSEWKEKIKDLYGEYGTYTYSFTPTGIGSSIRVKSHLTGLELDITDLDSW